MKKNNSSNKRLYVLMSITIFCFIMLIYELTDVQIFNKKKYINKIDELTIDTVKSTSTPRGRIYDRNYNLLVDNVGVKTIYYKKKKGTSTKDQIKIIKMLKHHLELDYENINIINAGSCFSFLFLELMLSFDKSRSAKYPTNCAIYSLAASVNLILNPVLSIT